MKEYHSHKPSLSFLSQVVLMTEDKIQIMYDTSCCGQLIWKIQIGYSSKGYILAWYR